MVIDGVTGSASTKIRVNVDNVAGVLIPKFQQFTDSTNRDTGAFSVGVGGWFRVHDMCACVCLFARTFLTCTNSQSIPIGGRGGDTDISASHLPLSSCIRGFNLWPPCVEQM
jgi:hypothetical protein